jgi:hypothetical protein
MGDHLSVAIRCPLLTYESLLMHMSFIGKIAWCFFEISVVVVRKGKNCG